MPTDPFNGRKVVTSDATSNLLPDLVDANYLRGSRRGAVNGVAGLNASGKVVDAAGVAVATTADVTAANAHAPYELDTVAGVYPPRPATTQRVYFMDPLVQPTFDGQLTGGGGMVPDRDVWWTGGTGASTG